MPLDEIVESLEGIDERYQDLYVENDDGKFEINIDGLKSALVKERSSRKKLEKKLTVKNTPDPDEIELKKQLDMANATIKDMKINSKVKNAAIKAGVDSDYVDDVILLTKGNFGLDDEGNVTVIDKDGDPTGLTLDKYFGNEFKKNKPRYYTSSGKNGSGAQPNLNGDGGPLSYNGKLQKARENGDLTELIKLKQSKIK